MKIGRTLVWVALGVLVASSTAWADDDGERIGEVHVAFENVEYGDVAVNDEPWSATEFAKGGKLLLIKGLPLSEGPFTITVTPVTDGFAPATFEVPVEGRAFRRTYDRSLKTYILIHKAKPLRFARTKDAAPEPPPDEGDAGDDGGERDDAAPAPAKPDTTL